MTLGRSNIIVEPLDPFSPWWWWCGMRGTPGNQVFMMPDGKLGLIDYGACMRWWGCDAMGCGWYLRLPSHTYQYTISKNGSRACQREKSAWWRTHFGSVGSHHMSSLVSVHSRWVTRLTEEQRSNIAHLLIATCWVPASCLCWQFPQTICTAKKHWQDESRKSD